MLKAPHRVTDIDPAGCGLRIACSCKAAAQHHNPSGPGCSGTRLIADCDWMLTVNLIHPVTLSVGSRLVGLSQHTEVRTTKMKRFTIWKPKQKYFLFMPRYSLVSEKGFIEYTTQIPVEINIDSLRWPRLMSALD
jgi:hypothetical protein